MRLLELFSGTGSVGRAFANAGYEVVSLDINNRARPTIWADVLQWDYKAYAPGHFDVIHASPPCTEYSKAKTVGARDLETADAIAARTLEIIRYLKPRRFFVENPGSSLLRRRPFMEGLPFVLVDYCCFGAPYRKRTCIWTDAPLPSALCAGPLCPAMEDGRHKTTAQHSPSSGDARRWRHSTSTLYALPDALCEAMVAAARPSATGTG
jgi:hypothetical protein